MQWLDNVIVQNILNELKQKKIKQSELAKGVGLSKETIAQRLNGTRSLSAIEMQRVADFLGVSLTYLTKNYNGPDISKKMIQNIESPTEKEVVRIVNDLEDLIDYHEMLAKNAHRMWEPVIDI